MNRILSWGLIGCGDIAGRRVSPALAETPGSRLTAVSRRDYSRAELFARKFGASLWMKDWRELTASPDIDAVYIATPVYLHADQAVSAAENGKHVLSEKPMAMNRKEADRMIDACRASGVLLGIAYYRHFYPAVIRIRELLAAGEIGRPVYIQSRNFERFDPGKDDPRNWLLNPERAGGGPMMDMGCHRIEVFLDLFGPVAQTDAVNRNLAFNRKVEDISLARFEFRSGAVGTLISSHASGVPEDTLEIYGTEGSILAPVLNRGTLHITAGGITKIEEHPGHPNPHQPLVEDFVTAAGSGREPAVNGEHGRAVTAVLDSIYRR